MQHIRSNRRGGAAVTFRHGVVVAIFAVVIASSTVLAAVPAWLKFTHPELGFSVSYPGDWMLGRIPAGVDFVALGPEVDGVRGMALNVSVTDDSVPAGISGAGDHARGAEVLTATSS